VSEGKLKIPKSKLNKQGKLKYDGMLSHKRSDEQEKSLAKRLKGRNTPRSGAGKEKGDVRCKGILRLEAKTTLNQSFSVTRKMFKTVTDAALPCGEIPAMLIEFLNKEGKPEAELAVVPSYVLDMLVEADEQT
jgi:hypothetical protein